MLLEIKFYVTVIRIDCYQGRREEVTFMTYLASQFNAILDSILVLSNIVN